MNKTRTLATAMMACVGAVATPHAFAQSSVTLYGIVDEGLTYSANQNGHSNWQMQSGVSQGSRWGLRGAEDLGGGMRAIFVLRISANVISDFG